MQLMDAISVYFNSQELRCVPRVGVSHQADPSSVGPWPQQGWQVPHASVPQRVDDGQSRRGEIHHQVPDEEGMLIFSLFSAYGICTAPTLEGAVFESRRETNALNIV